MPKTPAARPVRKPKLGQHFLTDSSAVTRIVEALGDLSQATVLEIGPGRGVLTRVLAKRAKRLIAIELDRVLAAQLRMHFSLYPNVEILEADVLTVDFNTIFGPRPGSSRPGLTHQPQRARLVGNLPYFITSDILLRFFEFRRYFDTAVVMVQREVADRLAASPGSSDYGLLSATAQLYVSVENLFTLPPASFSPPPKVHSSVIRMAISPELERLGVPEAAFIAFLKLSFGQKRKTLLNNLKAEYPVRALQAALESARIKPSARAETLSLEQAATLFKSLISDSQRA